MDYLHGYMYMYNVYNVFPWRHDEKRVGISLLARAVLIPISYTHRDVYIECINIVGYACARWAVIWISSEVHWRLGSIAENRVFPRAVSFHFSRDGGMDEPNIIARASNSAER